MTDPYDTHDENNTPEDNGWDGNYPPDHTCEDCGGDFCLEDEGTSTFFWTMCGECLDNAEDFYANEDRPRIQ